MAKLVAETPGSADPALSFRRLAWIPVTNAYAGYPFIDIWSESYEGYWTASTNLEIAVDEIKHHGHITSSIDFDGYIEEKLNTSFFRSDVPNHVDCASQSETVYTETSHFAYEYAYNVTYAEDSADSQPCYNVN